MHIEGGTVTVTDTNIYSNTAYNGGGVYIAGGTVNFQSCEVNDNDVCFDVDYYSSNFIGDGDCSGGGMYIQNGTVTVTDTDIYSNDAHNMDVGCGGGMYIMSGTVTVTGSNIYSNEARGVSACLLNPPGTFFRRPRRKKLP